MFDTTIKRSLLLLCAGSSAMCTAMGVWYYQTSIMLQPEAAIAAADMKISLTIDLSEYYRPEFLYALVVTAAGGMLQGFTGFGATLVMVPLLTFVYGPAESVAVGIGLSALGSVLLLPEASRDADWKDCIPACVMGFLLVPVGVTLLLTLDPGITRRLMGGIVILVAIIMIRGWNYSGPRNILTSAAAGSFSGFTAGFFGMGAPGMTIYYLSGTVRAAVQRANILIVLGVVSAATMTGVAIGGGADLGSLILGIVLILPFALPMWIGSHFFRRASTEVYRRVCLWLLIVMGTAIILL